MESNYNAKKDKKIVSIENYNFKNRKEEIIFKKESDKYTNEFLVGSHLTQNMKTKQPRGLMAMDCIVTGNFNDNYKNFLQTHIQWLIEHNQDFIIFSKKYLDDVKYPENVNLIEKSKLRLNPIKAIINTDSFESFFRVENSPKSFSYLWSFLVKKFYIEGKDLTIKDLMNMTDLEKLLEIKKECANDFVLEKMLSNYLKGYILETEDGS